MSKRKRGRSRQSSGGRRVKASKAAEHYKDWDKQIQDDLFERQRQLQRRRMRQQEFDFRVRAEDRSTARSVIGARRKKLRPELYAGAMTASGPRQYRTKQGRFTPAHPGYREFGQVQKNPCERRKERRQVLIAKGKVTRSGGAPGPYKPRSKIRWNC